MERPVPVNAGPPQQLEDEKVLGSKTPAKQWEGVLEEGGQREGREEQN